jgi:biopolymer transport protein ExbD
MAKFRKKGGNASPAINTSSLPDIVFMLLFFFMVTTVMRQTDLKVKVVVPQATEIQKLEKKSLVSYVYIGAPSENYRSQFGTAPRIQLNDAFASPKQIPEFIEKERAARSEAEVPFLTTSLKCDRDAKMGIVTDVKQELRKVNALKINYSSSLRTEVY